MGISRSEQPKPPKATLRQKKENLGCWWSSKQKKETSRGEGRWYLWVWTAQGSERHLAAKKKKLDRWRSSEEEKTSWRGAIAGICGSGQPMAPKGPLQQTWAAEGPLSKKKNLPRRRAAGIRVSGQHKAPKGTLQQKNKNLGRWWSCEQKKLPEGGNRGYLWVWAAHGSEMPLAANLSS